jgi:PPOX class probable F420-dependent enzyme
VRLSEGEIRRRFAAARVGYLATVNSDRRPHLVPVTFALRGKAIVTVTDAKPKSSSVLQRHRNVASQPHVSVLVDEYDDDWTKLWWARADGRATLLTQADNDYANGLSALVEKYPQYAAQSPSGLMIWIQVISWSGWSHSSPIDM